MINFSTYLVAQEYFQEDFTDCDSLCMSLHSSRSMAAACTSYTESISLEFPARSHTLTPDSTVAVRTWTSSWQSLPMSCCSAAMGTSSHYQSLRSRPWAGHPRRAPSPRGPRSAWGRCCHLSKSWSHLSMRGQESIPERSQSRKPCHNHSTARD